MGGSRLLMWGKFHRREYNKLLSRMASSYGLLKDL